MGLRALIHQGFWARAYPVASALAGTRQRDSETSCGSAAARFRVAAIASGLCELPLEARPLSISN